MSRALGQLIQEHRYIHSQGLAALVWIIDHPLNGYPSVTPVNSANTKMNAVVDYITKSRVTITFLTPVLGKAYLN